MDAQALDFIGLMLRLKTYRCGTERNLVGHQAYATGAVHVRRDGPPINRNRNHRDTESIDATVIKISTITYAT